jgi:hypothetical protein
MYNHSMVDPQAISTPWWQSYVFPVTLSILASVIVAFVSSALSARRERMRMIRERAFKDRLDWYFRITKSMSDLIFSYADSSRAGTVAEAQAVAEASLSQARRLAGETIEAYFYAPVGTIKSLTLMKLNLDRLLQARVVTNDDYRAHAEKVRNELSRGHLELAKYVRELLGLDRLPDDLR